MPQSGAPRVPGIVEQVALAFRDQRAGDLVVRQHCSSLLVSRSSCAVFARYCKGSSDRLPSAFRAFSGVASLDPPPGKMLGRAGEPLS
jgi:hypothetical protein